MYSECIFILLPFHEKSDHSFYSGPSYPNGMPSNRARPPGNYLVPPLVTYRKLLRVCADAQTHLLAMG